MGSLKSRMTDACQFDVFLVWKVYFSYVEYHNDISHLSFSLSFLCIFRWNDERLAGTIQDGQRDLNPHFTLFRVCFLTS